MTNDLKNTPLSVQIGVMCYTGVVFALGGYLGLTELRYAIPLVATGLVGAFFALYRHGRMTIVSALFGLILNLVLLFGMAAQDIFMAIQNGEIPNLHYGLPLVAGLFGYLLGQVNYLMYEEHKEEQDLGNVRFMRPNILPSDKDLAALEARISQAVALGVAEGVTQGLQQVLHPAVRALAERKSA